MSPLSLDKMINWLIEKFSPVYFLPSPTPPTPKELTPTLQQWNLTLSFLSFCRYPCSLPRDTCWRRQDSSASCSEGRTDHVHRSHRLLHEDYERGRVQGFVEGSWRWVFVYSWINTVSPGTLVLNHLSVHQLVCAGPPPSLVWLWSLMSSCRGGSTLTLEDSKFIFFYSENRAGPFSVTRTGENTERGSELLQVMT